ncbi:recombinase family protein [Microtetraspora malaysiensis]|uniref:recombinase family protein n=1 Tax=Microtetraspora malaysiensis TaxID=161358 RepID=UPI003D8FF741
MGNTRSQLHAVPTEAPRVIGYIRVSMAREEMISPELQRQAIEDYCSRRGYILDDLIEDLDATGRNFTRKGVQTAIERVESGGVAAVIVWKFSRFGRDRKGWAVNLDRVEAAGGRLESATEEVDTSTSTGRFTRGVLAEVAAWESERIGDQWKEAHARRARLGLPHNGHPRFGYLHHRPTVTGVRVCPQGCPPGVCEVGYVPDPETAPIVEEMYTRYNGGQSVLKIAMWLNGKGLLTTRGMPWGQRNVRRFMDTGFAAGLLRTHDNVCKCGRPHSCSKKILVPGAHPAIVTSEAWEGYLRARKTRRRLPPRVEAPVYPLAGLVRCARCEGPMNAHPGRPNRKGPTVSGYLYTCAKYEKSRACAGTWVTRAKVEKHVLAWLEKVAALDIEERAAMVTVRTAAKTTREADRKRLRRESQKLHKALTQLTIDRASGLVPEVAYAAARDELMGRLEELGETLESLAAEDELAVAPPVEIAEGLIKEWETLAVPARRAMLGKLIRAVKVTSYGKGQVDIDVVPTFPV